MSPGRASISASVSVGPVEPLESWKEPCEPLLAFPLQPVREPGGVRLIPLGETGNEVAEVVSVFGQERRVLLDLDAVDHRGGDQADDVLKAQ
jgi:hypothetical protein